MRRSAGLGAGMKAHHWIYAAAVYHVALAVFHVGFWRLFRWREELPRLRAVNRGVLQVLNIMLTYFFLLCAALQFGWPMALRLTAPGKFFLGAMAGFWLLRAVLQPVFWPEFAGKINVIFAAIFVAGAGLHLLALWPL